MHSEREISSMDLTLKSHHDRFTDMTSNPATITPEQNDNVEFFLLCRSALDSATQAEMDNRLAQAIARTMAACPERDIEEISVTATAEAGAMLRQSVLDRMA